MKNKLIIITGANGQVGNFIAQEMAKDKDKTLLLIYHNRKDRLDWIKTEQNVSSMQCDLGDFQSASSRIFSFLESQGTAPGALIHTAAIRSSDALPFTDLDPEKWSHVFNTNVNMALNILRIALPMMQNTGYGRIVMFGSDVTRTGLANGSAYAGSKAAIVNLVKSIARENAAKNVLINSISPSPVETDLASDYTGEYLEFRKRYFDDHLKHSPAGKLVSMKEIYETTKFLISENLSTLTGEEIYIDGAII